MLDAILPVAENIWLVPADATAAQPNVGILVTGRGTVLVDAGNSARHARRVQAALADIEAPPVAGLILTHHHWDHVFGAQAYNAPVIAQEIAGEMLHELANRPWSAQYIDEEMRRNPGSAATFAAMQQAVGDWESFAIVTPQLTFAETMTLYFDPLVIELERVGGQHALDSLVVRVRPAGVAFVGDAFYPPVGLNRLPDSTYDHAMVERLLADETLHTFVDGHTPRPQTRQDFARWLEL